MRQRISLRYHTQNNTVIYQKLEKKRISFFSYFIDIGHQSNHILLL